MSNDAPKDSEWTEYTKSITKLPTQNTVFKAPKSPIKIKHHVETPDVDITPNDQALTIGSFNNIDRNTANRFRKGEMPIEATLDLHGYNETEAYNAVFKFIKTNYSKGKRSILIITGKGTKKPDDIEWFSSRGILRDKVPAWLNTPELRPFILSITHPEQKLGGTGALQILLRRKRT